MNSFETPDGGAGETALIVKSMGTQVQFTTLNNNSPRGSNVLLWPPRALFTLHTWFTDTHRQALIHVFFFFNFLIDS